MTLPIISLVGCSNSIDKHAKRIPGVIEGASHQLGHQLRDSHTSNETPEIIETPILIVGGGVSGLSCAYHLKKQGVTNFKLVELENKPGGNARGGRNNTTQFPYGAHYVTVANLNSKPLINFYHDAGVITGFDNQSIPIYNTRYFCKTPIERIHNGRYWELDNFPYGTMSSSEASEIDRFFEFINNWKNHIGQDGLTAFTIPMEDSSKDPNILKLDNIPFSQLLAQQGFTSTPLSWYAEYCCRDDFGAGIDKVSAWAGLHYFCARQGFGANTGDDSIITWPEGNQWLVDKLRTRIDDHITSNTMATSVKHEDGYYYVSCQDFASNSRVTYKCSQLIMATPKFINQYLLKGVKEYRAIPEYAPWIVATITTTRVPGSKHARLSWDNFNYLGNGLGYIYAQHQTGKNKNDEYTLSYYWPISHLEPKQAREWMLSRNRTDWNKDILNDLETMNPGISEHITSINIWLWGHAMATPRVGTIWSGEREKDNSPMNGLIFAHSDMSGFSIFEEAFDRGYRAAEHVFKELT